MTFLLILSESEGIAIKSAHLPRSGDVIDVLKDYGSRERVKFTVTHVEFETLVDDMPNSEGIRGHVDSLPMVHGKVTSRRIEAGVWKPVA